ncbi:MAG: glycerol-3-phosphate dehydrogenase [Rhodobacteraceae bacterium]|nr:MAG: glycerol-3-phosphate dehydrogenase [Paracoccaceae bacterium]
MDQFDVLVIGGGVNGCGIARDAAGRGLSVALVEQNDLASATSSASTKLFHGGLRYLEHYEFGLVKKALIEREILLKNMPHISWPMRFVIPHLQGMRPKWMLRIGLFIYDHIGGRKILPTTRRIDLQNDPLGTPLVDTIKVGFEYSDCWVDDARLVVLNARDAADRGACIWTRTQLVSATQKEGVWTAILRDAHTGKNRKVRAKVLVNATGPWVKSLIENQLGLDTSEGLRMVRGSHIVVPKLYDHDRAYFFQNSDGRLIFTLPYETDFTLIGTTDADHVGDPSQAQCSEAELTYLCDVASRNFKATIKPADVVYSYAGVRPLHDNAKGNASAASRDYLIKLRRIDDAPLINIFGGKITTYRKLAEQVVHKLSDFVPMIGRSWTHHAHLPGGDFALSQRRDILADIQQSFPFFEDNQCQRFLRSYGTDTLRIFAGCQTATDLGQDFGAGLTAKEVRWLMDQEWAQTAQDVIWRRTKLGLRLSADQVEALDIWMQENRP